MRRIRALLIAEAANPEWTSVPLVGWSHSQAIAELADSHLVTQVRNRDALVRAGLTEGRDFTAIDSEIVARRVSRIGEALRGGSNKGWTTIVALGAISYCYFEHLVWQQFSSRIKAGEYDVVHRITPLSPTVPSLLAKWCCRAGTPFVLGPLNGGVSWPAAFDGARRQEREWLSYVRSAHRLLPGYRSTRKYAAAIIVGSRDTWKQVPQRYQHKCVYMPENGIDPRWFAAQRHRRAAPPLRAVFIGRLVPYKGADMLLEAAAPLVRSGRLAVSIIGDGPQMPLLRDLVAREGLQGGVSLEGWVAHQQLSQRLCEADVLAFPSIREFGGGVVLEAMATGLAPVVVDYGGPGELVTADTGVLIPLGTRQEIIRRFREALENLADHPAMVDALGAAARSRARENFSWSRKAQCTVAVYESVVQTRTTSRIGQPASCG